MELYDAWFAFIFPVEEPFPFHRIGDQYPLVSLHTLCLFECACSSSISFPSFTSITYHPKLHKRSYGHRVPSHLLCFLKSEDDYGLPLRRDYPADMIVLPWPSREPFRQLSISHDYIRGCLCDPFWLPLPFLRRPEVMSQRTGIHSIPGSLLFGWPNLLNFGHLLCCRKSPNPFLAHAEYKQISVSDLPDFLGQCSSDQKYSSTRTSITLMSPPICPCLPAQIMSMVSLYQADKPMLLNSYLTFLSLTHRADMLFRLPRSDHRDPVSRRYIYMPHTVPELHFVNTDTVVNIRSFYNLGFQDVLMFSTSPRYVPIPFGPSTPFVSKKK